MELAEQKSGQPAAAMRTRGDEEALAFHGESYERMMRVRDAASKLSETIFTHGENTAEAERALEKFDELVYPEGMNSKIAQETAPAFIFKIDESGELKMLQVDPRTHLPLVD